MVDETNKGNGVNLNTNGESSLAPVSAPVKEKEMVQVPKDVLQTLLTRVEKVENDNQILREVADKNRLGRVEEMRAQGKLVKSVNLNTFEGKIIVGWRKIKDDVYLDTQGRLHEDQVVGLIFQGETEVGKEMDIRSFGRLLVKIPAEVIEEGKDKEGNINFTVQTKDGREVKIDSKFVN